MSLPAIDDDEAFAKMREQVELQVAELGEKVAALAARKEADLAKKPERRANNNDGLIVFCEFEAMACTADTEALLLGAASDGTADERKARFAALDGQSLEQAMGRLEDAGVTLAPGFVEFAEDCLVRKVPLHILSRGWKPVIAHFLRGAGLGHVQVSANHLLVSDEGKWRICFRDNASSGHDKAEAIRRALRDVRPAQPRAVLVGRFEDDLGPVEAEGLVQDVYAPPDSALAAACARSGRPASEFVGWEALSRQMLPARPGRS